MRTDMKLRSLILTMLLAVAVMAWNALAQIYPIGGGGSGLPLSGGTMTGPINMGTNNISNGGTATFTSFIGTLTGGASLDLPLAGGTMSGNIAMGGGNISGGGTSTFTTFVGALTGHASLDLLGSNNLSDVASAPSSLANISALPAYAASQILLASNGADAANIPRYLNNFGLVLSGTVYYVDSVNGNDSNAGTDPNHAWASLTKVNAATPNPGDIIAFRAGQTFSGTLNPYSGTQASPVIYTTYGKPNATIAGGTSPAISATNPSGIWIQNLICTGSVPNSAGSGGPRGVIYFNFTATGTRSKGITLYNLTVTGGACGMDFTGATGASTTGCNYIEIAGCNVSLSTEFGLYFQEGGVSSTNNYRHFSGVWIHDNQISSISGDNVSTTASGNGIVYSAVDDSVPLRGSDGMFFGCVCEYNTVSNCGASVGASAGANSTGIYGETDRGILCQWNIVTNQQNGSGSTIGHAFGIGNGGGSSNQVYQYNLGYNCLGAGLEFDGGVTTAKDAVSNYIVRDNLFVDSVSGGQTGGGLTTGASAFSSSSGSFYAYNNTVLTTPSGSSAIVGAGVNVRGTGIYFNNNIVDNPNWIGCQWWNNAIGTVAGNIWNASGSRVFYETNTTTTANTLSAIRALGFEGGSGVPVGALGTSGLSFSTSDFAAYPTNPHNLPGFFSRFAVPPTSAAYGVGINVPISNGLYPSLDGTGQPQALTAGMAGCAGFGSASLVNTGTTNGTIPILGSGGTLAVANGGSGNSIGSGYNAGADFTAQSAANSSVTTFTTVNAGTYEVGGYVTITAATLDVLNFTVTYTDETSTSRTVTVNAQNVAGTDGVAMGPTTGVYVISPIWIHCAASTAITEKTVLATGSGSIAYNVGGTIRQVR